MEKRMAHRNPKVLIPFTPATEGSDTTDFFIFLRPESNGVMVESVLLRVIQGNPEYKERISIVYMANIPGGYIIGNKLVEQHYHLKISFAHRGGALFTPYMRERFSIHYGEIFNQERVIGAFEALERLGMTEEELFHLRVPRKNMLEMNGQTVKRYRDVFIVNYDIPALLHKNSYKTDIAVMVFRSSLDDDTFDGLIKDMGASLVEKGIVNARMPISHVFHYSKGPFEFLLDAEGYLLTRDLHHEPLGQLGFSRFLHDRGVPMKVVQHILKYPILIYSPGGEGGGTDTGSPKSKEKGEQKRSLPRYDEAYLSDKTDQGAPRPLVERDIFHYTFGDSFEEAYQKLITALGQHRIS